MDISILLTTYNRDDDCILCLNKLLEQRTEKVEIILLNDLHLDSKKLKDFCTVNNIKYIFTGAQKGGKPHWRVPGFALNIGAKQSCGDYLILGNAEILQISNNTVQLMYDTGLMAFARGWDQPSRNTPINTYKRWRRLGRIPFFMGVPRESFFRIGGYDEDFTGYAWEDRDLVERLDKVIGSTEVDADIVHLWNIRGKNNRDYAPNLKSIPGTGYHNFNSDLFYEKRHILVRNQNKEWGVL